MSIIASKRTAFITELDAVFFQAVGALDDICAFATDQEARFFVKQDFP